MAETVDIDKLSGKISNVLNKNTAMPKELRASFEELREQLKKTGLTANEIKKIEDNFISLKSQMIATGKTGASVGDKIKKKFGDVAAYFSFDEKNLAPLRRARYNSGEHNPAGKSNIGLLLADGHEYSHKGKMESASGIIDRTTGSIQLKVVFPNPDNEILSGSSGVVRIPATYPGCITVPQNATYELQDKIMIFVVNQDNSVTRKIITVEGTSGKDYVVSSGLQRGDRIVIEGADKLKDGTVITPKE